MFSASPSVDISWAFYSQQQIQFKWLCITHSVTCSHFWDSEVNNLLSDNTEYEVINKLPRSEIVPSHSTWKQKTFGIMPCSSHLIDCWREPKNQRTRYKTLRKKLLKSGFKEKKHLVMGTRMFSHLKVPWSALQSHTWKETKMRVKREQVEEPEECTHQCAWDGFTNVKDYISDNSQGLNSFLYWREVK